MRTLVHLSDLHFGAVCDAAVRPLIETVNRIKPDVIAVSGDLTQRARTEEFRAARSFLDQLPGAKIVVPGNHDVPLYNLAARWHYLKKYRRHISEDLEPFLCDQEIAVLGINTARSLTFKSGRINESQVGRAKARLSTLPGRIIKIIVSHHPFDLPAAYRHRTIVGRARMAIHELNECKLDIFLAGHFHLSGAAPSAINVAVHGYSSLIVQAGTALSTRIRAERNTFNLLRMALPHVSVEQMEWHAGQDLFAASSVKYFVRGEAGWSECDGIVGARGSLRPA